MKSKVMAKALAAILLVFCTGYSGWGLNAELVSAANPTPVVPANNTAAQAAQVAGADQAVENLLSKAFESGSVLVLVELALSQPFAAEAELHPTAVLDQRTAIAVATDQLLAALDGSRVLVAGTYTAIPYLALRVDHAALVTLAGHPLVASIQEDVPAPPSLESSTNLIGVPVVWANGVEGSGQTVVILDSGVDTDHPFLAGSLVDGACFSNANGAGGRTSLCPNGSSTQYGLAAAESDVTNSACWNGSTPLCAHGTHVAGITAGAGAPTFSGVARRADIIAIQVFTRFDNYANCGGSGTCILSYMSDQMRALDYAYVTLRPTHSLASVNMSLGSGQYISACDGDGRKPAIDNLRSAGIATVIAAGNNGYRNALSAPACISTAIAAGGVTDTDSPPADRVLYNLHSLVDLLAPGQIITSSYVGGGYATMSGTSMAAPHVTGAFALCKSANPALSVSQIETILEQTGAPIRDTRSSGVHTRPRLQMDAAVNACQEVAVWTGAASMEWSNPANWNNGVPPSLTRFANIPSTPAGGRFPVINSGAEVRSLLLEPGAQLNLTNATLTLHGSLEVAPTAQLNATGSTIVFSGNQLASISLPANQRLHHVHIGQGDDTPVVVALDSNLALNGALTVLPGATLDLTTYSLTVEGAVSNRGTLRQSRNVASGVVQFLRLTNAGGSAIRYWGVDLAPAENMGNTAVSVAGHQACGAGAREIQRCYEVTPTTARPADITFYYTSGEANGVTLPATYHWDGAIWQGPLDGTAGGNGDAMFVTTQAISTYSTFAVCDTAPLAVLMASLAVQAQPDHVLITWETVSELDNAGFRVLRSQWSRDQTFLLGFVPSQGPGATQGYSYAWQDFKVEYGETYWYWIEAVDLWGAVTRFGPAVIHYGTHE